MSGGGGGETGGSAKTPADSLKSTRGRPVVVKLNSGIDYRDNLQLLFKRKVHGTSLELLVNSFVLSTSCGSMTEGLEASLLLLVWEMFGRMSELHHILLFKLIPGERRILACLDGYMNIAMEQTEEYVNGRLKNNSLHQHIKKDQCGRRMKTWKNPTTHSRVNL